MVDLLLDGLATDLHTQGLGVWRPDSPYTPTERGIVLHQLPEDPPELISLTPYAEAEVPTYRRDQEVVVRFVQIRLRLVDPNAAYALQTRIRDRYHRRRITFAVADDLLTVTGQQQSRGPLGQDQNARFLFTQNFSFTTLLART